MTFSPIFSQDDAYCRPSEDMCLDDVLVLTEAKQKNLPGAKARGRKLALEVRHSS